MRVYQFRHVGIVLLVTTILLLYCGSQQSTTCCWWCPRRDSNPYTRRHMDLNHARLPIPPRGHCAACYYYLATVLRITTINNLLLVVPTKGLEPLHPKAHGPEPCASTNSATWALCCLLLLSCYCTADHNNQQLVAGGAHEGTRTPTPEGTWT